MKTRFLSKTGRASLAAVLPLCGALMSSPVLAFDFIGGNANIGPGGGSIAVNTGACQWTILETVSFQNLHQHYCIATGSADAIRPVLAGEHTYHFTVSDAPNPVCNQGQERTLTFLNQGGILDNRVKEITTTGGWMAPAGGDPGYFTVPAGGFRTLYFLARKAASVTPQLLVDDASLTVTCMDNRILQ